MLSLACNSLSSHKDFVDRSRGVNALQKGRGLAWWLLLCDLINTALKAPPIAVHITRADFHSPKTLHEQRHFILDLKRPCVDMSDGQFSGRRRQQQQDGLLAVSLLNRGAVLSWSPREA
jgi:hypothetical protein